MIYLSISKQIFHWSHSPSEIIDNCEVMICIRRLGVTLRFSSRRALKLSMHFPTSASDRTSETWAPVPTTSILNTMLIRFLSISSSRFKEKIASDFNF